MIKLIEENTSVLLAICPECLSKFTLEVNDIIYLYSHSDLRGVICPVCSSHVTTSSIEKVTEREVREILKGGSNE